MGDSYWRYGAGAGVPERDGVPRASFPGYVSSEASFLSSHHLANDLRGTSSDYLQKDILPLRPGAYGLDTFAGLASHTAPGFSGLTSGASLKGFPSPLEDPALSSRGIPELLNERPSSLRKVDSVLGEESSILFVDGLPSDCTRRELARHKFGVFKTKKVCKKVEELYILRFLKGCGKNITEKENSNLIAIPTKEEIKEIRFFLCKKYLICRRCLLCDC